MVDQGIGPPTFFAEPAQFRDWLAVYHLQAKELWVGFRKRGTCQATITWPEAVDEALCVGWIDGVRKSIDAGSYMIRFTPRKKRSIWSTVNIQRVGELSATGRMRPAGLVAFEARTAAKSGIYTYEQTEAAARDAPAEEQFRANKTAWEFFQAQPPWYRRTAIWWVISGKQVATRQKRLATLIEDSAHQRTLARLTRRKGVE
ncbi:MAG: YdeI family protein [Herpetosiphon sp.]